MNMSTHISFNNGVSFNDINDKIPNYDIMIIIIIIIMFSKGPPEGFETYYGVGGDKGDGNVFRTDNILELQRFILANTNQKGISNQRIFMLFIRNV